MFFNGRADAGSRLGVVFVRSGKDFSGFEVVGIARGGVIVAAKVAEHLNLPLHAVYESDTRNDDNLIKVTSLDTALTIDGDDKMDFVPDASFVFKKGKMNRFVKGVIAKGTFYNGGEVYVPGKKLILCDDGVYTGLSIFTIAKSLRERGVAEIVVGVPVVTYQFMHVKNDFEVISWRETRIVNPMPTPGKFYIDGFGDTPDEDVVKAIESNRMAVVV
jgi:predicted phosphoribosyltransferase